MTASGRGRFFSFRAMRTNAPRRIDFGPWLSEANNFLWLAGGIVFALITCGGLAKLFGPRHSELIIRATGTSFELSGIFAIFWEVRATGRRFGHPSTLKRLVGWSKRCPARRRTFSVSASGSGICIATGTATVYVTASAGPNPTIESRVEAIEKNIKTINDRISGVHSEMDAGFRKAADALGREVASRQEENNQIRASIEATATGELHISLVGAVLLVFGVALSHLAPELALLC